MIEEARCATWEAFTEKLDNLECERKRKKEESRGRVDPWLYRGQADSKWQLRTTLERKSCKEWHLPEYGELILSIYPKIKKTTGREFKLPTLQEFQTWARNRQIYSYYRDPIDEENSDFLKYLIYLRHHEFPSPLLDWTECPYIAAYFAFRNGQRSNAKHAAIFAFLGYAGSGKTSRSNESSIESIGPAVIGHTRHFVQQSWYTVACQRHDRDQVEHYSSHEDAFGNTGGEPSTGVGEKQDFLLKFVIPIGEGSKVRRELYERDITRESLFNADERLLNCLWEKRSTSP